jgi:hypothetical protein
MMPDEDELLDQLADLFNTEQNIDPVERSRRIALLNDQLRDCLREIDTLGLLDAGAHLDMTLHAIEKIRDPQTPGLSSNPNRLH